MKISHVQKDRRIQEVGGKKGKEHETDSSCPVYSLFIGPVANRAGELVRITFKGQELEALTGT